jgi:membrane protein implicated in regulation of membrane protease activity
MRWIRSVAREVLGLFVDDGSFALAILVWLAVAIGVLPRIAAGSAWTGPIFFAGLALILIQSAWRFSRQRKK